MFLSVVGESRGDPHRPGGEHANSKQKDRPHSGIEPRTFSLWVNSASHYTAVLQTKIALLCSSSPLLQGGLYFLITSIWCHLTAWVTSNYAAYIHCITLSCVHGALLTHVHCTWIHKRIQKCRMLIHHYSVYRIVHASYKDQIPPII